MRKIIATIIFAVVIGLFPRYHSPKLTAMPSKKYTKTGKASWYSRRSPGIKRRTASNEIFNENGLTCAIWGVEFNRMVKITNLANGKSVVVRVNDRGPSERCIRRGRVIDLTKAAFSAIASPKQGVVNVEIEFL